MMDLQEVSAFSLNDLLLPIGIILICSAATVFFVYLYRKRKKKNEMINDYGYIRWLYENPR